MASSIPRLVPAKLMEEMPRGKYPRIYISNVMHVEISLTVRIIDSRLSPPRAKQRELIRSFLLLRDGIQRNGARERIL